MFAHLLPLHYKDEVIQWIKDDCPSFDVGGFVVGEKEETAHLYCKQNCTLAGVPFANIIFDYYDLDYEWNVEEGTYIDVDKNADEKGRVLLATVSGKCRFLLQAERTMLNILSRSSGIATSAYRCKLIKEQHCWDHGFIAGTRKTTPGFRFVEKYSLIVGGVSTHRLDLSQMVMLKDNHISSAGSITNAVKLAKSAAGFSSKIEVRK
jgi:nicotinate-nucleotide pyrophosphorylase (carboxylating)